MPAECRRDTRSLIALLPVLAALLLGGCSSPGSGGGAGRTSSLKDESAEVLGPRSVGSNPVSKQGGGWTIVLAMYSGEDEDSSAAAFLRRIRTRGKLPEAFMEKRAKGTIIAVGNFADPADPAAQAEFRRIRELEVEGGRPYALSFFAPPEGAAFGSRPEFDLRRVVRGPRDTLYTLQVGYYGRDDRRTPSAEELAEFRSHAESAAATLRREGEMAFYYHSPRGSSVTIGLFGPRDVAGRESDELKAVRSRHPHSLFNGRAMRERSGPREGRLVPSMLVEVPRDAGGGGR